MVHQHRIQPLSGKCLRAVACIAALMSVSAFPGAAIAEHPTARHTTSAGQVVYKDRLSTAWENWSWDSTVSFRNANPTFSGRASVAVTFKKAWAGFSLRATKPIKLAPSTVLSFRVHGGTGSPKLLSLTIQESDSGEPVGEYEFTAAPDTWTEVTRTLESLGSPAQVARITIKDNSGSPQSTFYLDDIRLTPAKPTSR